MVKKGHGVMKYLLDTNVLIAMFRNQHGIRMRILQAGIDNCLVSEATLAEIKVGAYKLGIRVSGVR